MSEIGDEEEHVTRDSETSFEVKMSKVNLQGAGALCGGLPAQLVGIHFFQHTVHAFIELLLLI